MDDISIVRIALDTVARALYNLLVIVKHMPDAHKTPEQREAWDRLRPWVVVWEEQARREEQLVGQETDKEVRNNEKE